MEMEVYYTGKGSFQDLPVNLVDYVQKKFSHYEYKQHDDQTVTLSVPTQELIIVDKFLKDAKGLLLEIQKENDALARNLARRYGFRLQ